MLNINKLDDPAWLYEQYIVKCKSQSQIGRMFGRSGKLVSLKLKKYGIKTRSSVEGMQYIDYRTRNRAIYEKSRHKIVQSLRREFDDFVSEARKVHGDRYEYVDYINKPGHSGVYVTIRCKEHDIVFYQRPVDHLKGKGCKKCGVAKLLMSKVEFVEQANKIHNGRYRYDGVVLANGRSSQIQILCTKHGGFTQVADYHLRGHGCPMCANDGKKSSHDQFVARIGDIYGDHYTVLSSYQRQWDKVAVRCKTHGEFQAYPNRLLCKRGGCPKCSDNFTNPQREVAEFLEQYCEVVINDRSRIHPYEIDCATPTFGVELHGVYWHSYNRKETKEEKYRHHQKADLGSARGYLIYQVYESEWREKPDIIKSMMKSKLDVNSAIYARKCVVVELDNATFNRFMDVNHLQGRVGSRVKLGLMHNGTLVCCMGFNRHNRYGWEVSRFANIINHNVVGGAGRIFKHFIKQYNPKVVVTYCDRRYSLGNLYKKLGFCLDSVTTPGYFYVKDGALFNRRRFQKSKLDKLEKFDPNLTESQNMFNNGFRRLWDAGHFKFIWRFVNSY